MLGDRPVDKHLLGGIFLLVGFTVHVVDPHANKSEGMRIGNTLPYSAYGITSAGTISDTTSVGGIQPSPSSSVNTGSEYNGTSWSGITNYPISMYGGVASCASPGSDVTVAGGRTYPGSGVTTCNEWDGSSWSSGGSLSTARYVGIGAGTASAMAAIGGEPGTMSTREDYNGSSWSSGTSFPTTIVEAGMTTAGPATDWCFANGRDGSPPYSLQGYSWNGSSYSTFPKPPSSPSSSNGNGTNFGSGSSNLISGLSEYPPGQHSDPMEWNGSAWSAIPASFPGKKSWTSTATAGNASTNGAGVIVGGSPHTNATVEYQYGLAAVALN